MSQKRKATGFFLISGFLLLLLAWSGGLLPLAAQGGEVQVTSANPPEAEQGTVSLDVTIGGKNFDKGSKSAFFLTGTTNPGGITVNSTRFVNSTTLTANITVAADAVVSKFDIAVTTPKGRTGKGTELFAVKQSEGGTTGTVSLNGVFRDALGAAAPIDPITLGPIPDRIVSDCSGGVVHPTPPCAYVDGVNGANLSVSGNDNFGLSINAAPSNQGARNLILNFSDCVSPGGLCTPPFLEGLVGTTLGTFATLVVFRTGDLAPGDLAVGQSGMFNAQVLVGGGVVDPIDGETEAWFVSFRTPGGPRDDVCSGSGSGPLVVRHPTADTWEVEATTGNLACLFSQPKNNKANVEGTEFKEFHGTYTMPFLLRLERKP